MTDASAHPDEIMSSSTPPPRDIPSSDAADHTRHEGSPPSSPPDSFPWEKQKGSVPESVQEETTEPPKTFNNVFSILGKRKALGEADHNARTTKTAKSATATASSSRSKSKDLSSGGLTQMQMSLGQTVQKRCSTCGMTYTASVAEDRKLHDKYHKQNIEGYDMGKAFIESTLKHRPKYGLFKGVKDEDKIVYLDRYDHVKRKDRGQAVLEIVQRELGAVEIKPEHIWEASDIKVAKSVEPVYGAFLYVRGSKCVGFLLVQTIEEAWKVMPPTDRPAANPPAPNPTEPVGSAASKPKSALAKLKERKKMLSEASKAEDDALAAACNAPLSLSSSKYPAILGVSRIWTSSSHRGQGIAACLLNTAINRHNAQVAVEIEKREEALQGLNKERPGWTQNAEEKKRFDGTYRVGRKIQSKAEVAFSHPTDAGTRLARKWFGKAWGWRIYSE